MPTKPLSKPEFIALMATLIGTLAMSIDTMLPAMPSIAAELTPDAPNRAQLVVTSLVLGMGLGTLVMGPLSDSYGRKRVLMGGAALFMLGAVLASYAPTLEIMLAARLIQGFGGAAARVVVMAIIRDLYSGRQMAQMVSFVMVVFSLIPAIAPSLGAGIIAVFGWRAIFDAMLILSAISIVWLTLRQPETLPPERRKPLRAGPILLALREVLSHRTVRMAILAQALLSGVLFGTISSTQMIFDQTFGQGDNFPLWFALIAVIGSGGGFLNAYLVVRIGMRDVILLALRCQAVIGAFLLVGILTGFLPDVLYFPTFMVWSVSIFALAGMTLGNLNALALEPLGHIAGTAASVITAVSTVIGVFIAVPIGLMFDGTPVPITASVLICVLLSIWAMQRIPKPTY